MALNRPPGHPCHGQLGARVQQSEQPWTAPPQWTCERLHSAGAAAASRRPLAHQPSCLLQPCSPGSRKAAATGPAARGWLSLRRARASSLPSWAFMARGSERKPAALLAAPALVAAAAARWKGYPCLCRLRARRLCRTWSILPHRQPCCWPLAHPRRCLRRWQSGRRPLLSRFLLLALPSRQAASCAPLPKRAAAAQPAHHSGTLKSGYRVRLVPMHACVPCAGVRATPILLTL